MGGTARIANSSSVPGLGIVTTVELVSRHRPIPTTRAAIALQGGKEKVAISLTAAVDYIAPISVFAWNMERTTSVYARMVGPERIVNLSSVLGQDIVMTVELAFQHQPIPTSRAAIALPGGKEKTSILLTVAVENTAQMMLFV
ncbi:hypothetical protein DPMN_084744 [Dreissena polymorpha]|uniref:Uncharacterized protein n=1 Tax=Dreissena polymorpha TaxID=45954 RepID=A0A9D4BJJ2_DREPO|nr:hypothetical protein DPMN_084744 [Dreissena polymorpha]